MRESAIRGHRLVSQMIAAPSKSPATVVGRLGAVQAQDYHASLWAIGLRCRGASVADVEAAIVAGTIVRSWPMRGTLHWVASEDLRWMLEWLTPRVIQRSWARLRQLGLDAEVLTRCRRVVGRQLRDGRPQSRTALFQALEQAGISTTAGRGLHILSFLAQTAVICCGPRQGRQPTFVLLDAWVPTQKSLRRDEALGELAARYFGSRGPALATDLGWWAGLTVRDANVAIECAGGRIRSDRSEGRVYWRGVESRRDTRSTAVHLLPAFDEYTVAYRDRSAVLDSAHVNAVNRGGGILNPVVIVRGRVAATWKRALGAGGVSITVSPLVTAFSAVAQKIEVAGERYRRFLGVDRLHCDIGTVRRH